MCMCVCVCACLSVYARVRLSHSLARTRSFSHSHSLTFLHALSLSLADSLTPSLSLSLALSHTLSHSLFLTHTHCVCVCARARARARARVRVRVRSRANVCVCQGPRGAAIQQDQEPVELPGARAAAGATTAASDALQSDAEVPSGSAPVAAGHHLNGSEPRPGGRSRPRGPCCGLLVRPKRVGWMQTTGGRLAATAPNGRQGWVVEQWDHGSNGHASAPCTRPCTIHRSHLQCACILALGPDPRCALRRAKTCS